MKFSHVETAFVVGSCAGITVVLVWGLLTFGTESADLTIETTPDKASAHVDGRFVGTTPVELTNLAPGTHVVRLEKFSYHPLIYKTEIRPGDRTITLELIKRKGGSVEINSTPFGADIIIDGEERGQTPVIIPSLGTGGHSLRLRLVNYLDWTKTFEIPGEGQKVCIDAKLTSRMEALYLAAIAQSPDETGHYIDIAHYYVTRGEWTKAEEAFTQALIKNTKNPSRRLRPEITKVYNGQFTYDDLQRGREAIARAYVAAVKAYPTHLSFYYDAVRYCVAVEMNDEAQDIMEAGILAFPYNWQWALNSIQPKSRTGRNLDRYETRLNRLIKNNPDSFVYRYQRLAIKRSRGKTDGLVEDYGILARLSHSPRVKSAMLSEKANLLERKSKYVEAAEAYRQAIALEKTDKAKAPILFNLARVLGRQKDTDATVAVWEQAIACQQNVEVACDWRLQLAKLCIDTKKTGKARTVLEEVLKQTKVANKSRKAMRLLKLLNRKLSSHSGLTR